MGENRLPDEDISILVDTNGNPASDYLVKEDKDEKKGENK